MEQKHSRISFGFFKSQVKSPIDGKIINISKVTGQVVISEKPLPVKVDADLAVDDVTGAQGNVKFLLAPRIDRD